MAPYAVRLAVDDRGGADVGARPCEGVLPLTEGVARTYVRVGRNVLDALVAGPEREVVLGGESQPLRKCLGPDHLRDLPTLLHRSPLDRVVAAARGLADEIVT